MKRHILFSDLQGKRKCIWGKISKPADLQICAIFCHFLGIGTWHSTTSFKYMAHLCMKLLCIVDYCRFYSSFSWEMQMAKRRTDSLIQKWSAEILYNELQALPTMYMLNLKDRSQDVKKKLNLAQGWGVMVFVSDTSIGLVSLSDSVC